MIFFTKMHGSGSDFIVIENQEARWEPPDFARMAKDFSTSKIALGSEALLILDRPSRPDMDFFMRLFHGDGTEGEISGNGARCLASYAFHRRIAPWHMRFGTPGGLMEACVEPVRNHPERTSRVTLYLGDIDMDNAIWEQPYRRGRHKYLYSFLNVSVPHCVIRLPDLEGTPRGELLSLARALRFDRSLFPDGTNVNFVEVAGSHSVRLLTYERGAERFTPFCGTGAMASAIAMSVVGGVLSPVTVETQGGVDEVTIDPGFSPGTLKVQLCGEAHFTARGTILDEFPACPTVTAAS